MRSKGLLSILLCIVILMVSSCNGEEESFQSDFPNEFFLLNKKSFGRFFYENQLTGQKEFQLYLGNNIALDLTETKDSVCLQSETETACFSKKEFFDVYGKPLSVQKVSRNQLHFSIDTLEAEHEDFVADESGDLYHFQLSILRHRDVIYRRTYKSNKLVTWDTSNINIYTPVLEPEVHFIDGEKPCLVLEMGYYDQYGEFGGWERFETDIKSIHDGRIH